MSVTKLSGTAYVQGRRVLESWLQSPATRQRGRRTIPRQVASRTIRRIRWTRGLVRQRGSRILTVLRSAVQVVGRIRLQQHRLVRARHWKVGDRRRSITAFGSSHAADLRHTVAVVHVPARSLAGIAGAGAVRPGCVAASPAPASTVRRATRRRGNCWCNSAVAIGQIVPNTAISPTASRRRVRGSPSTTTRGRHRRGAAVLHGVRHHGRRRTRGARRYRPFPRSPIGRHDVLANRQSAVLDIEDRAECTVQHLSSGIETQGPPTVTRSAVRRNIPASTQWNIACRRPTVGIVT